ncbi:NTP transferase domain-containing protein [Mycetocola sp. 2940]|uniref:molybdenum cofactor guanylyltransferase n=1 Tax=Mycetocola sp. 2940 TaxID=3156452 RepID=UPI0033910DA3
MTTQERTTLLASLDVVVLAGGRGSRLGGVDKPALLYTGVPLGQLVLSSVRSARRVAWVGESTPALAGKAWPDLVSTREQPAFAGPSAALAAGLTALDSDPAPFTLVLAADLPRVVDAVPELLHAFERVGGGVLAVDETGRRQFLLAIYPTGALRAQLRQFSENGPLDGLPLRRLIDALDLTEVRLHAGLCADVDTAEDAARHGIPVPTKRDFTP